MACKCIEKTGQFIFRFDDRKSNPDFNFELYEFEPEVIDGSDYVFRQKDLTNILKAVVSGNSSHKLLF